MQSKIYHPLKYKVKLLQLKKRILKTNPIEGTWIWRARYLFMSADSKSTFYRICYPNKLRSEQNDINIDEAGSSHNISSKANFKRRFDDESNRTIMKIPISFFYSVQKFIRWINKTEFSLEFFDIITEVRIYDKLLERTYSERTRA